MLRRLHHPDRMNLKSRVGQDRLRRVDRSRCFLPGARHADKQESSCYGDQIPQRISFADTSLAYDRLDRPVSPGSRDKAD